MAHTHTATWKVIHTFVTPMAYAGGPTAYAQSGVTFEIENEEIVSATQTLSLPTITTVDEVIAFSTAALRAFWDYIEYHFGYVASKGSVGATKISEGSNITTNQVCQTTNALIAKKLTLPPEQLVFTASRLSVWIRLALDSRNSPSDVDAIRNYSMILEDKYREHAIPEGPAMELRHTRHFVSHGKVSRDRTLAFLKAEMGTVTVQYNPYDERHAEFVKRRRSLGKTLIDGLIAEEINSQLSHIRHNAAEAGPESLGNRVGAGVGGEPIELAEYPQTINEPRRD